MNNYEHIANTFTTPLTADLFYTVRYLENIHLYFWMLKDLAWANDYKFMGVTFGTIALMWIGVLFKHAFQLKSSEEMYFLTPVLFWLLGNYLWMYGELVYNSDSGFRPAGAFCMFRGIEIIIFYHLFCKIFKLMKLEPNETAIKMYNEAGLKATFSYFSTFRQYEHFHTLCWLGKDLCWNTNNKYLWFIFVIPTFVISGDFIRLCSYNKKMTIDMAHYIAQFMWVLANIVWAFGELFVLNVTDKKQYMFNPTTYSYRWCSAIILFCAWIPIIILYFFWIPLTYFGYIKKPIETKHDNDVVNPIQQNIELNTINNNA